VGCVVYPAGVFGNGVTALPGGAIAATSFIDPRDPKAFAKIEAGAPMGGVLVWRPKTGWRILPGAADISAPNGIEASPDGKLLYVAGTGDQTVMRLSVDGSGRPAVIKTDFRTDNLRWGDDGALYAAGARDSIENLLKCAPNTDKRCDNPFSVMRIDPKTLQTREVVRDPGHPEFGAASTALKIGGWYWLGTPHGDRIAVTPAK
jgi:sugar lactone lactonase YvrE